MVRRGGREHRRPDLVQDPPRRDGVRPHEHHRVVPTTASQRLAERGVPVVVHRNPGLGEHPRHPPPFEPRAPLGAGHAQRRPSRGRAQAGDDRAAERDRDRVARRGPRQEHLVEGAADQRARRPAAPLVEQVERTGTAPIGERGQRRVPERGHRRLRPSDGAGRLERGVGREARGGAQDLDRARQQFRRARRRVGLSGARPRPRQMHPWPFPPRPSSPRPSSPVPRP